MFSAALVNVPSASAASCYGDYCSGVDPLSSGCANDAYTVATGYVYGSGGSAWVEIRWSPTCQTNWARANGVTSNVRADQAGVLAGIQHQQWRPFVVADDLFASQVRESCSVGRLGCDGNRVRVRSDNTGMFESND
ncbi:hypothetical protein GCM10020255_025260 [Rhodococcus baikonurensis]